MPLPFPVQPVFTPPVAGQQITSGTTGSTYRIESLIGQGHFGMVYSGTDDWRNDLAIKVFKPRDLPYETIRQDAVTEYQKLVTLRHPNITHVFDAFEYQHTFYIVTERCLRPLSDFISGKDFNGNIWLLPIARCVLQAIHFIHVEGYVHQDLHLENVFAHWVKDEMLPDREGAFAFKVGDLGLTKLLPDIDAQNTFLADWMLAPEAMDVLEYGPLDRRMDIYHCGLLFLQVLSGTRLSFSKEEVLSGIPRERALALPAPYNFALEKALRRHAQFRTQSAMEFWRDLNSPVVNQMNN